jgi:erythromycin esterase
LAILVRFLPAVIVTKISKHTGVRIFIIVYLFCACTATRNTTTISPVAEGQIPCHPLRSEVDLDILINEIGKARIVLLGEASHGTAEYYNWRAAISKRLITEKGFNVIAVEGDYIDLYRLNQYLNGKSQDISLNAVLSRFNRWPQWLWSNEEFADFVEWIKNLNVNSRDDEKVKLLGLDVFNFAGALDELVTVLNDSTALYYARPAQECFKPYGGDALRYSTAVSKGSAVCKEEVYNLWQAIQKIAGEKIDNEKELALIQHASVVMDGEQYFRLRNADAATSWNTRVRHMQEMIGRMLRFYGRDSKLIVWAHNTHVGDAHYTDMPSRQRTNIGELLRKEYGEKNVFSVGFGSYSGEIIAGYTWGAPFTKIKIRPAKEGSWEQLLHADGAYDKIVLSKDIATHPRLKTWTEQRAIGVVYSESYVPSVIPRRYDAFIYFDSTHAVHERRKE